MSMKLIRMTSSRVQIKIMLHVLILLCQAQTLMILELLRLSPSSILLIILFYSSPGAQSIKLDLTLLSFQSEISSYCTFVFYFSVVLSWLMKTGFFQASFVSINLNSLCFSSPNLFLNIFWILSAYSLSSSRFFEVCISTLGILYGICFLSRSLSFLHQFQILDKTSSSQALRLDCLRLCSSWKYFSKRFLIFSMSSKLSRIHFCMSSDIYLTSYNRLTLVIISGRLYPIKKPIIIQNKLQKVQFQIGQNNNLYVVYLIMLLRDCSLIRGLKYFDSFLTIPQKQQILQAISSNPWCTRLQRRQQYYGIKYFQTKIQDHVLQPSVSTDHFELSPLQFVIDRLIKDYHIFEESNPPNQILVNRYLKNDKLGLHVEDKQAFGHIIVGVSLGSTDYLRLMDVNDKERQYLLELKDRSCYVLSGEARESWRHGIGRIFEGNRYKDEGFERISLTVRHVIESRRKIEI